MKIFLDDRDYRRFVSLLSEVVQDFEIRCWNYCAMPNHYHLMVEPTLPNLSRAMKHLNSVYAQWWNRRHERVGHVFQGRFKDQVVQHDQYQLALCRYIARNPLRASLVRSPEEWRWSSYGALVGCHPDPDFLDRSATLRQFGDDEDIVLQARFRDYVLADPDLELEARIRSAERVVGDRLFKRRVGQTEVGPRSDRGLTPYSATKPTPSSRGTQRLTSS
jgi:putative transposase